MPLDSRKYVMKVEARMSDGSTVSVVSNNLSVAPHDRSGFAFPQTRHTRQARVPTMMTEHLRMVHKLFM